MKELPLNASALLEQLRFRMVEANRISPKPRPYHIQPIYYIVLEYSGGSFPCIAQAPRIFSIPYALSYSWCKHVRNRPYLRLLDKFCVQVKYDR